MVIGHGIDLVDLEAFGGLVHLPNGNATQLYFNASELADAGEGPNRLARLAARFAAKEAVLKALGTGWDRGISWTDVQIVSAANGQPNVRLSGKAQVIAEEIGVTHWALSLSHTEALAVASAIALQRP